MQPARSRPATLEVPDDLELPIEDVPELDPRETIRRGAALVSEKVGLTKAIGHGIYRAQDPATFAVGIISSDLSRFSAIRNSGKAGGGGESLEIALAATLGEAVERYCMLFYDQRRTVFGTYRELQPWAVHPDELRLHSREQVEQWRARNPKTRSAYFDEDTSISWAWGWSLTARQPRLVPATLVFLEPSYREGEKAIGVNASSGLAAGLSREQAILSGLYEVVERDAFTMSWLHRRVGRRIVIDDPELRRRLAEDFHADRPEVDLQFYEITLDIPIPSILSVLRRPAEFGPSLCLSSVTRLSPRAAVNKALREMGQSLPYLRYLRQHLKGWEPDERHRDLTSFDHHFLLYSKRPELAEKALAHLGEVDCEVALSAIADRSTGTLGGDVATCVELLRQAGREVIVSDITTADVLEVGFRVVRVVIPGLVPLHGNHNVQFLGVRRLYDLPRQLGWVKPGSEIVLNHMPHPFP